MPCTRALYKGDVTLLSVCLTCFSSSFDYQPLAPPSVISSPPLGAPSTLVIASSRDSFTSPLCRSRPSLHLLSPGFQICVLGLLVVQPASITCLATSTSDHLHRDLSPHSRGWLPGSDACLSHHVTSHVKLLDVMLLDFPATGKGYTGHETMLIPLPRNIALASQASFVGAVRMTDKMRSPAAAVAIPASK